MQRLSEQFIAQLPDFARPDTPFMRAVLTQRGRRRLIGGQSTLWRVLRLSVVTVALLLMPLVGWYINLTLGNDPMSTPRVLDRVFITLYWVLVAAQALVRITTFNMAAGSISATMRDESWDTLKATADGATLSVKTNWAAIFYRLAPALIFLMIWRIFFVFVMLTNLTEFQGRALDVFLGGTTPLGQPPFSTDQPTTLTLFLVIFIMAMTLTACLLAPLTAAAFDAAFGVWIGTVARGRLVSTLGQATLMIFRVLLTIGALWLGNLVLMGGTILGAGFSTPVAWLATLLSTSEGDLGLSLLHLPNYPQLWATVDFSVFIGVAFLAITLLQAFFANVLLKSAVRRANRADRI